MTGDPILRRVERTAVLLSAIAMAVAWIVPGGGWWPAAGVAGGALLAGASYWAIKRGVTGLAARVVAKGAAHPRGAGGAAFFVLRYALLAGMAYVMIARLRLPPAALLVGASTVVGAVVVELFRGVSRGGRA